ncbi:MAG: glycoside hydrolase family 3 N-terminal domain-containing protein [Caldilineaceae bacterium]
MTELQQASEIPLLGIANMEHGAAEWQGYGTNFPSLMAAGAANDPKLFAALGKATAVEARHIGVNWCLTPTSISTTISAIPISRLNYPTSRHWRSPMTARPWRTPR